MPKEAGMVDPFRNYNFKLLIHGVTEGHFTECSGLEAKIEVVKYREAGANQIVHHLPGRVEYSEVTLKYGLTESDDLWKWFMDTAEGKVDPRNISIVLLDKEGSKEIVRWNLFDAWPSQWRGAPLQTLSHGAAIETLTLVFNSMERS